MSQDLSRRSFLAGAGAAAVPFSGPPVRVGLIGAGNRGRSLLGTLLATDRALVPAVCDIVPEHAARALEILARAGQEKTAVYTSGEEAYKQLLARDDLDAVVIATPWNWHTPMAVAAMHAHKYAAVEVPAALSVEECWQLVRTHEATGVPCMMLENWSFRRDNLAVLNMIRKGMLGEILHCHCAHSHNVVDHWFFDPSGKERWAAHYLYETNRDQYPTHSLGPVLSWMDLNCGDYFDTVASTATRALGVQNYFKKKFGADHPNARRPVRQGDIVTTVVKTKKGNTIVINYDMQLPRPYDNRWMIQGTEGVYKEQNTPEDSVVYLAGRTDHWPSTEGPDYETWKPFGPFQEKHDHIWWRTLSATSPAVLANHGGTDYLELLRFLEAVRNRTRTPIDVYDSVLFSVIGPLSSASIAAGSVPVKCPDFTAGKWKTRRPSFALEV
ncbi:MAG TPA: Gfo/Idh/MocA family oxidoreductase [Bryobacteraceae bacterium]